MHYAEERHGGDGLTAIHPFGKELLRFKEEAMPTLKKLIPMYADFQGYLNQLYRSMEMKYIPFDEAGRYDTPNLHTPQIETAYQWYANKTSRFVQRIA